MNFNIQKPSNYTAIFNVGPDTSAKTFFEDNNAPFDYPHPPYMGFYPNVFSNKFQMQFLSDELVRLVKIHQVFNITMTHLAKVYNRSMELLKQARSLFTPTPFSIKDLTRIPATQTLYKTLKAFPAFEQSAAAESSEAASTTTNLSKEEGIQKIEEWVNEDGISEIEIRNRSRIQTILLKYIDNPGEKLILDQKETGYVSSFPDIFNTQVIKDNLFILEISNYESSTILPHSIFALYLLKDLKLTNNNLTSLSTQIGQLKNLNSLILDQNKLSSIPKEIGLLTQLRCLNLSHNKLASVPTEIGQLNKLEELILDQNELSSIPKEIGLLTQLNSLDLSNNNLSSLPTEIGLLINLKALILASNKLILLPKQIGQLNHLECLYLSINELTSIPTEIGNLSQLIILSISDNKLTALPTSISKLSLLKALYLVSNKLAHLPIQISQLTNLKTLYLTHNKLTSLPPEIGQLSHLKDIDIEGNPYRSLPASLLDLDPSLKIELTGHQLSPHILENLQTLIQERTSRGERTPRIIFDMPPPLETLNDHRNTQEMLVALSEIAEVEYQAMPQFDNNGVALWLKKLLWTTDLNGSDKKEMAQIVLNLFEEATRLGDDFVEATKAFLMVASQTCEDRVTLSIIDLELIIKLNQLNKECDFSNILTFLKKLFAYSKIRQIADLKVKNSPLVDEVDIHLGYLIKCKEALGLPISPSGMRFFRITGITDEEIEYATKQTQDTLQDNVAFLKFLATSGEPLIDQASDLFYSKIREQYPEQTSSIDATLEETQTLLDELKDCSAEVVESDEEYQTKLSKFKTTLQIESSDLGTNGINSEVYAKLLERIQNQRIEAYAQFLGSIE